MKIGFDAKRFFLNDRGLGNYSRNLIQGLVKYTQANQYYLYSPSESSKLVADDLLNDPSISVRTPKNGLSFQKSIWRSLKMGKSASKDRLDIFHGLSMEIPYDYKRMEAKIVVTIHDLIFLKYPEFYKPIDRSIYYHKLKYAVNNSDHIIAISQQTKKDLLDEFGNIEDKIDVVYQSCNEVFYERRTPNELNEVKNHMHLPEKFVLCVGALNENKNMLLVLKAMASMDKALCPDLVVVGKGKDYRAKMEGYADASGLRNRLHFVNDDFDPTPLELSCLYQLASVFVFPSFYEGFGIPILEARFSEIPVLASNSTCLEEAGGKLTTYFDPEDHEQLATLLTETLEASDHKLNYPNQFKLETVTKDLNKVYQAMLESDETN